MRGCFVAMALIVTGCEGEPLPNLISCDYGDYCVDHLHDIPPAEAEAVCGDGALSDTRSDPCSQDGLVGRCDVDVAGEEPRIAFLYASAYDVASAAAWCEEEGGRFVENFWD